MTNVTILAPLHGWAAPLEEAPDPVFSQRMLGEGVAIDPTHGSLHAPCDAEVRSVAPSSHAIVLRAKNGAEILLHVGIDTVALNGQGFRLAVRSGARVRAGELLMEFDLDALARGAKSLITPIVITNSESYVIAHLQPGRRVAAGDALFELQPKHAGIAAGEVTDDAQDVIDSLLMEHEHGIHARPAALIAAFAKRAPAPIRLAARGRSADARSAVSLMSLGVRRGDRVEIRSSGPQAVQCIAQLKALIAGIKQEPAPVKRAPARTTQAAQSGGKLQGVIASRGFAVGRVVQLRAAPIEAAEDGRGVDHESAALDRARVQVRARLEELARRAAPTAREVIAAHLEFLDDCELIAAARRVISQGRSAGYAWRRAVRDSAEALRSLGDARMIERIDDLLDLESQVLMALDGRAPQAPRDLPEEAIVIADDLKPSQLVALDAERLAGVCMAAGGPTSHVAILAAAIGVPALAALGPAVLEAPEGAWLVLDAEQGALTIAPDEAALAEARRKIEHQRRRREVEQAAAHAACRTADGERIEVFANLGSLAEAHSAVANGAEGCGLLRTEFLFLEREAPPEEEEQLALYQGIADALGGRPLVVRTLDVGGDKPIPYLPAPPEENPALGLRGVRASLWRPDLLRVQLKAILRVRPAGRCRVLLPMITDAAEVVTVRRLINEIVREIGETAAVQVGAMIETPACALMAHRIAREVDFLSIGTNDLTQYTLAMDRGHQELAHRIDALHPAVVRLIAGAAEAARAHSLPVAVCGGLASDPAAAPLLIGLGVRELSVTPALIPRIKSAVRARTLEACRILAQQALELDTAEAVRALVDEFSAVDAQVTS